MTTRGLVGLGAIAVWALGCSSPSIRLGDENGSGGSGTALVTGNSGSGALVSNGGATTAVPPREYVGPITEGQLMLAMGWACQGKSTEREAPLALPCVHSVPPVAEGALDPDLAWIAFTDAAGVRYGVERNDSAVCDQGWHYTANGSQIEICGQTCARVEQASEILLIFGCEAGLAPGNDTVPLTSEGPPFETCSGFAAEPEVDETGGILSCVLNLPPPLDPIDRELVFVVMTDASGVRYEVLRNRGEVCDRGWHYTARDQMEICGETCQRVKTAGGVEVLFGCVSGLAPGGDIVSVSTAEPTFAPCIGQMLEREAALPSWPLGCSFNPPPTAPDSLDPELVWVTFVDSTGALFQVQRNDAEPCLRGWHYVAGLNAIELCQETCERVQAGASVQVQYGCRTE